MYKKLLKDYLTQVQKLFIKDTFPRINILDLGYRFGKRSRRKKSYILSGKIH